MSRSSNGVSDKTQSGDERKVGDPRERADGPAEPTERDIEEGTDDHGIELGSRAKRQLLSRGYDPYRLLVRADRGHHLEGIRDRHDAGAEAELVAGQSKGVTGAVVALVVLFDDETPLSEPRRERGDESPPLQRMVAHLRPLLVRQLSGLVQGVGVDAQLSDVVKERGPPQPISGVGGEMQLLGDHVGECSHSLGVASRRVVMAAERSREREDLASRIPRDGADFAVRVPLETPHGARSPCDLQSLRRLVREQHRHLEERGEWKEAPTEPLESNEDDGGRAEHRRPPRHVLDQGAAARRARPTSTAVATEATRGIVTVAAVKMMLSTGRERHRLFGTSYLSRGVGCSLSGVNGRQPRSPARRAAPTIFGPTSPACGCFTRRFALRLRVSSFLTTAETHFSR